MKNDTQLPPKPIGDTKSKEILGSKPSGTSIICYKCRQIGHKSSECPLRQFQPRTNLIENANESDRDGVEVQEEDTVEDSEVS